MVNKHSHHVTFSESTFLCLLMHKSPWKQNFQKPIPYCRHNRGSSEFHQKLGPTIRAPSGMLASKTTCSLHACSMALKWLDFFFLFSDNSKQVAYGNYLLRTKFLWLQCFVIFLIFSFQSKPNHMLINYQVTNYQVCYFSFSSQNGMASNMGVTCVVCSHKADNFLSQVDFGENKVNPGFRNL